jgi:hypothetical protein
MCTYLFWVGFLFAYIQYKLEIICKLLLSIVLTKGVFLYGKTKMDREEVDESEVRKNKEINHFSDDDCH